MKAKKINAFLNHLSKKQDADYVAIMVKPSTKISKVKSCILHVISYVAHQLKNKMREFSLSEGAMEYFKLRAKFKSLR